VANTTATSGRKGRPRDAQATQKLLLAAAAEEFAEHGLAGARIDRIAERAGANKRLLYVYFGDKQALFDAVIERHVGEITQAIPMTADDLGAFAGAVFDHVLENPQAERLAAWRNFESPAPTEAERVSIKYKLKAITQAQREGKVFDGMSAADLLALTMQMATSWLSASPALRAAAGKDPFSATRLRQHRKALVDAVRRITEPH
jgi:AcrR family transcriptional regulator